MNPPPVTYTTSGLLRRGSGICMSINRSIDLPFASVRVLKTTSSSVVMAVLPQAIWSDESGRMTMLVPVLLAATVVAMTGFGRIPVQNRNGIKPWSGATVGQVAKESAAARAAINTLKARNTVADATLEVLVISYPLCHRGGPNDPRVDAIVDLFNHRLSS
jgi:hypothetical protein